MRIRKYQIDSLILCLDYEPGVVTQMLEYSYRYITSVLEDARLYANHARYGTVPTVPYLQSCGADYLFLAPAISWIVL